jgi:hypothetical protein
MIGSLIRAILSKWFFLVYFGLGLVYFFVFPLTVTWIEPVKSFFVTLALMTGSDPYSFKEVLESHGFVWALAWLIHITSWLLIPALIAIVIGEAKEEIKNEQELEKGLRQLLAEAGGDQGDVKELRGVIDKAMKDFKKG